MLIKIQTTTITEFNTTTGKTRVANHYAKVLGTGTNAKKKPKKTLQTDVIKEEYI